MAKRTTSIKTVLDNILVNPLLQDLTIERAIVYCIRFMRLVGNPLMFTDKLYTGTLTDYRLTLPNDCLSVRQVRTHKTKTAFRYTTDTFHMERVDDSDTEIDGTVNSTTTAGVTTYTLTINKKSCTVWVKYKAKLTDVNGNVFYKIKSVKLDITNYTITLPEDFYSLIGVFNNDSYRNDNNFTYKIQNNVLYASCTQTDIDVDYIALELDEDGYPVIPDDPQFSRALELFIKKEYYTILFDLNKISQAVLQNTQQEYAWAVGACKSNYNLPTIDEMESLKNSLVSLFQNNKAQLEGFRNLGAYTLVRKH